MKPSPIPRTAPAASSRSANDHVVAIARAHKYTCAPAADDDVVTDVADRDFDVRSSHVERGARGANDLNHVQTRATINRACIGEVLCVSQNHVIASTCVEYVCAQATGQPVVLRIARQCVIARATGDVLGAQCGG